MSAMKVPATALLLGFLAWGAGAAENDSVARGREAFQRAQSAYLQNDFGSYLAAMEKAVALRPRQPTYLYHLAGAEALSGHVSKALGWLKRVAAMGMVFPASADKDLVSLKGTAEFDRILQQFRQNDRPVGKGRPLFRVPRKGLIAEGLARDPASGDFFLGSVRQRAILRIDAASFQVKEFSGPGEPLAGVFGMKVDPGRGTLWACSSVVAEMEGFRREEAGSAEVLSYDLKSGKLLAEYPVPQGSGRHVFGDLALDRSGNVYVSDSASPGIWILRAGASTLEPFLVPGPFTSPQGLDLSADGKSLFLADYSAGIFRVDVARKTAALMASPENVTLLGIDGIYRHGTGLVAVQNGTEPSRVVGLRLDQGARRVERLIVLQAGTEKLSAPTLGVVAGNRFYVVANSEWEAFDPSRHAMDPAKTRFPSILQIDLPEDF